MASSLPLIRGLLRVADATRAIRLHAGWFANGISPLMTWLNSGARVTVISAAQRLVDARQALPWHWQEPGERRAAGAQFNFERSCCNSATA
jgi:hypothetical protein